MGISTESGLSVLKSLKASKLDMTWVRTQIGRNQAITVKDERIWIKKGAGSLMEDVGDKRFLMEEVLIVGV